MIQRKVVLCLILLCLCCSYASGLKTSAHSHPLPSQATVTVVSSASFTPALTDGCRASAFGTDLATAFATAFATQPDGLPAASPSVLPTMLGGTKVEIIDSESVTRLAPLFFVSPSQLDLQIPAGTATGNARIVVTNRNGQISRGEFTVAEIAPSAFSANKSGSGAPAGFIVRQRRGNGAELLQPSDDIIGAQHQRNEVQTSIEPLAIFDPAQFRFVPNPIKLNRGEEVSLVLLGTGFRNATSSTRSRIIVNGVPLRATFTGAADAVGLDRIQAILPRSLDGRGEVNVVIEIDGKKSNTLKIAFD